MLYLNHCCLHIDPDYIAALDTSAEIEKNYNGINLALESLKWTQDCSKIL